jgi:hypothetical protein
MIKEVGFDIFMAVTMKNAVFWDVIAPYPRGMHSS